MVMTSSGDTDNYSAPQKKYTQYRGNANYSLYLYSVEPLTTNQLAKLVTYFNDLTGENSTLSKSNTRRLIL